MRAVELTHRDAVRRADERAVGDTLERREHVFERRREGDDGAGPFAERLARLRHAAPIRGLDGVGGGVRMCERIEHDAAPGRVCGRVDLGEGCGECGAEAVERSRERDRLDGGE